MRVAFAKFGGVLNVRLVRDPKTFVGKGIGYVQFESADGMKAVLAAPELKYRDRVLRLKRATDPKRREKKAGRK